MTDNELLLALSDMIDIKLKTALQTELQPIKDDIRNIKLHLENVTDKNIQLLAENYVPAARRSRPPRQRSRFSVRPGWAAFLLYRIMAYFVKGYRRLFPFPACNFPPNILQYEKKQPEERHDAAAQKRLLSGQHRQKHPVAGHSSDGGPADGRIV